MKKAWLLMMFIALAGCANKSQREPKSLVTPAATPASVAQQPAVSTDKNASTSRLTANETCVRSLAALRTYSPKNWNKYSEAMAELNRKNSLFISVRDDLNPQLEDLVLNAYDSKMKTLCYRIESTLGQAMVSQVDPM